MIDIVNLGTVSKHITGIGVCVWGGGGVGGVGAEAGEGVKMILHGQNPRPLFCRGIHKTFVPFRVKGS